MRNDQKHLAYAIVMGLLILVAGGGLFAWPNYRKNHDIHQSMDELDRKIAGHDRHRGTEERLLEELRVGRLAATKELRVIPRNPDIADLMRRLSLPVDQVAVRDQTFTAGTAAPVLPDDPPREMMMPLTVDMEASFDSVFALLRSVEVLERLVRISSVRMSAERRTDDDSDSHPVLMASVGLEAIYDPGSDQ